VFGPNTPGLAVPGETLLGVIPTEVLSTGTAGVVSRAGTLTYEILQQLTRAGLGQRVVVGLGSEHVAGTSFEPVLEWFERDSLVQEIVLVGGVSGGPEGQLADYIKARGSKPIVAYLPGRHSPGSLVSKAIEELENADVSVARSPWELPRLLR
jgi:succinyl-CoA synthetase alpha subunit